MKKQVVDTEPSAAFLVRQATGRKYLHIDPLNGDWWGPKVGAFQFRSESEACLLAPYFTKKVSFTVISAGKED